MKVSLRTVKAEDILKFQYPSNPTISPNGQHVVYERSVARMKEDDYETHLFLTDIQGKSRRQLTTTGTCNVNPVWASDGSSIAFISNRSYGMQLWLLPLVGGEAERLTSFRHGISCIVASPDGKFIYGLVPVEVDGEVEVFAENLSAEEAQEQIVRETNEWRNGSKRYNRLYYKNDGSGLQTSHKKQIVAICVSTGACQQLTRGTNDASEPAVSPDGEYIAFTSSRDEEHMLFGGQIYRVAKGGGEVELLYSATNSSTPSYSPDGKSIALFSTHAEQKQLLTIPADGGDSSLLSKQYYDTLFDWTITDIRYITYPQRAQWSKDSKYVLALGTREGRNEIVRFSADENDSKAVIIVGGDRAIFHFSYDGDQVVVAAYSTVQHPGKIAAIKIDENHTMESKYRDPKEPFSQLRVPLFPEIEVRLDDCNDEIVSELIIVEPEVFSYRSEDNWVIQGFMLLPANFDPEKKYPVLLEIHGGPHGAYSFTYFHQLQLFAAQGYAVVYTNPRGSTGFGEEFTTAVHSDYGGKDMADILNGLDDVLQRFDFLDRNRVAVNGLSYGGFMVNWLVTHTDRFFTAVAEGSICNWISMYGTSDIGTFFVGEELGKTDMETLWGFSPLAYVENVKTPLLLIHCENDLRCPIEQAEQFYAHIKKNGGEVEFLRIPNSSHLLLQSGKPTLRVVRLQAMFDFVDSHLPVEVLLEASQNK
jgi:dipeptidyl aminopeptidase/acylaminoacyl peptidase